MLTKLQQYQEYSQQLKQRYDPKFFDTTELQKQIQKVQGRIDEMLMVLEDRRQMRINRTTITQANVILHPQQKVVKLSDKAGLSVRDKASLKVEPNSELTIIIKVNKMVPLHHHGTNNTFNLTQFRLNLHHLDQIAISPILCYSPQHNLYTEDQFTVEPISKIKQQMEVELRVTHRVTLNNWEMVNDLVNRQYLMITCENAGRIVCAIGNLNLSQLNAQSPKNQTHSSKLFNKNILFLKLRSQHQLSTPQNLFILCTQISLEWCSISPPMQTLIRSLSVSKLRSRVSRSQSHNSPSRSPSPIAKKNLLQSIVKPTKEEVSLQIFGGYQLRHQVKHQFMVYEDIRPVFNHIDNIKTHICNVENTETLGEPKIVLTIVADLQKPFVKGSLTFSLQNRYFYEVEVLPNLCKRQLSIENARHQEIAKEFQEKKLILIELRPNLLIYPSDQVMLSRGGKKKEMATNGKLHGHYFKSSLEEQKESDLAYESYPQGLEYYVKKVKGGFWFYFYIYDPAIEQQGRPLQVNLAFSVQSFVSKLTHIHSFECQVSPLQSVPLSKSLQIGQQGFYGLDMTGLLQQKCRYKIVSCNPSLLHITNGQQYTLEDYSSELRIQVMQKATSATAVTLLAHNLTKYHTTPIELTVFPAVKPAKLIRK